MDAMPKDAKEAKRRLAETRPTLDRHDPVVVEEDGIKPWSGTVQAVKPSLQSGWWVEVRRNGDGTWVVHADRVRRIA